jgi:hypothetical protein
VAVTTQCVGGGVQGCLVEVGEQHGFADSLAAGDRLPHASGTDDDQNLPGHAEPPVF